MDTSRAGPSHLVSVLDPGEQEPSYLYWSEHNSQIRSSRASLHPQPLFARCHPRRVTQLLSHFPPLNSLAGDRGNMRISVLLAVATVILGTTSAAPAHKESGAIAALGGGDDFPAAFGQFVKHLWVSAHART